MQHDVSVYQSAGQCLVFSAEFNLTGSFFYVQLYFTAYNENKEIMNSNIEIYSVL
jgi:hypothetical protein